MGSGRSVPNKLSTDAVANDAAMSNSQPRDAVAATLTRIANGAAFAAPAVSSEICAAESSTSPESQRGITDSIARTDTQ